MLRREFMQTGAVATAAFAGSSFYGLASPVRAYAATDGDGLGIAAAIDMLEDGKDKNYNPELRPEILNNPRAVFLIETHVEADRDDRGFFLEAQPQLYDAGKMVASRIFTKGRKRGGSTLVVPNMTDTPKDVLSPVCGIFVSPDFIAGFNESMHALGNSNFIVGQRGAGYENHVETGIYDVFNKYGVKMIEAKYKRWSDYDRKEVNWNKVPGKPMVWNRIPTFRPIGDKDNYFINMAKLKCHNLGMTTLTIKNLQGTVPTGYGHYCNRWDAMEYLVKNSYRIDWKDFEKDYYRNVESAFLRHRDAGFKYWDIEGTYPVYQKKGGWKVFQQVKDDRDKLKEFMEGIPGGLMWDEQWNQRAMDSASAIVPDLNIIEGVIGRDGSGFNTGRDQLANVVVVGQSMLEVDAVGTYIMGHDPNEVHYTRIGKERGLGESDPSKIDIYWIRDNNEVVKLRDLSEIKRTPLGVNMHTWAETGKRLFF